MIFKRHWLKIEMGDIKMRELYDKNEKCMSFKNEEIIEYLVKPIQKNYQVDIRLSTESNDNISFDTNERIRYVCFDGEKEDFYASFLDYQTAIFILNEEFMFIDDYSKEDITSSETYGNVVYEGMLRDKCHKEILEIIYQLFTIIYGAKKIDIQETEVSQQGIQYPKCSYKIKLTNGLGLKSNISFENILFLVEG